MSAAANRAGRSATARMARAASSTRNSGLPPPRSTRSSTRASTGRSPSPSRSRSRRTSVQRRRRRADRAGRAAATTGRAGWWPEQLVVGALAGDQQERQVGQRADDDGEEVANPRVGPLQVVDPQHRHPRLGVAAHRLGDHPGDAVPGAGRVELVELGRMAEQVGDDAEQPLEQVVAGLQRPQLRGALFDGAADVVRARLGSRASSVARPLQSGDHRLVSPYGEHAVSGTIASSASGVTM